MVTTIGIVHFPASGGNDSPMVQVGDKLRACSSERMIVFGGRIRNASVHDQDWGISTNITRLMNERSPTNRNIKLSASTLLSTWEGSLGYTVPQYTDPLVKDQTHRMKLHDPASKYLNLEEPNWDPQLS